MDKSLSLIGHSVQHDGAWLFLQNQTRFLNLTTAKGKPHEKG
jgi:hypothetical protein